MSEHFTVSTLLSFGVHEEFQHRVRKLDVSMNDYLRGLILADLGFAWKPEKPADAPQRPSRMAGPKPLPEALPAPPAESVADLIARGFTPNQIAAKKRMPYAQVMRELGSDIDRESERERTFHQ